SPPEYWIMFLGYDLGNCPFVDVEEHNLKEHRPRWHYQRGRDMFPSKEIALAAALVELEKEKTKINEHFDQLQKQLAAEYEEAIEDRAFGVGKTPDQAKAEVKEWLKGNAT
ncbi:MAG: hypothetical protein ACK5X3_00265, partial [Pseudomonadota bacterium]